MGLIGDALGFIPVTLALGKLEPLYVAARNSVIFDMIPIHYGIQPIYEFPHEFEPKIMKSDLHKAFNDYGNQYHMTQAHFPLLGLPIPPSPIRPELDLGPEPEYLQHNKVDFIISPFSFSLPDSQKWPIEKYCQLAERFPGKTFWALGSTGHPYQDTYFEYNQSLFPKNPIYDFYDKPLKDVGHFMKKATYGLISVVSGTSHLAHALEVPNILMTNQGPWGENPDATQIRSDDIRDITVDEVEAVIRQRFNL